MSISNDLIEIEIQEVYLDNDQSKNFLKIKFDKHILKFTYESSIVRYPDADNINIQTTLTIFRFVNPAKNFPYDILLIQLYDKDEKIKLNSYDEIKNKVYSYCYDYFIRITKYFYYQDFIVCLQQRDISYYDKGIESCNYYNTDISIKFEQFKNFQINNILINQKKQFLIEYTFFNRKYYSKAERIKVRIDKEDTYILFSKLVLTEVVGYLYFVPSKIVYKIQEEGSHNECEYIDFDFNSEKIPLCLLPYNNNSLYPFDIKIRNIYSTFINKSIVLNVVINPFLIFRIFDKLQLSNFSNFTLSSDYHPIVLDDNKHHDDELSHLLDCKLNNEDTKIERNARDDTQYDKRLYNDDDDWDSLDFEQRMDIDPFRAIESEETEAYNYEKQEMEKFFEEQYYSENKNKIRYSYILCGFSKEFLHLELKRSEEEIDYYTTNIISILPTNFIIRNLQCYTGFIYETKLVIAFKENMDKENIQAIFNNFRPNASFQFIDTYSLKLIIEI